MIVGRWSALQQVHGTGNQCGTGALDIELREKVEKELANYYVAQEKKSADDWLVTKKEATLQETKNRVKPLPLPD